MVDKSNMKFVGSPNIEVKWLNCWGALDISPARMCALKQKLNILRSECAEGIIKKWISRTQQS